MTTRGAPANNRPQMIEDLDALMVSRSLRPAKVKVANRLWTIKRDFTATQIVEFWTLQNVGTQESLVESYAMVVGTKDAPDFYRIMEVLPNEMTIPMVRRLLQLAGIIKRPETPDAEVPAELDDSEGESSASSQES